MPRSLSLNWHILVFLTETSRVQLPLPPNYRYIKKYLNLLHNISWPCSVWLIKGCVLSFLSNKNVKLHDTWKAQSFWLINAVENGSLEISEIIFLDIMLMWMLLWWGKQVAFLSATKLFYSFSALCSHPSQMLCTEERKIFCFCVILLSFRCYTLFFIWFSPTCMCYSILVVCLSYAMPCDLKIIVHQ